ncbi:MAG: hypothetical protein NXH75_09950, partial [Halobacteriovoraceae bacterium]|nr:hypothetical protein [Halobacteriovoraceae bacterium]
MKNIVIAAIALLSISSFAGETERDFVKVTGATAQGAYQSALSMADMIKDSKREAKLPMLRNCNFTGSDAQDRTWYSRNAWVNSSQV